MDFGAMHHELTWNPTSTYTYIYMYVYIFHHNSIHVAVVLAASAAALADETGSHLPVVLQHLRGNA